MDKQNPSNLTNEAKLKINSVLKYFHNVLDHYDTVKNESGGTITLEQFISGYVQMLHDFDDLTKNGTPSERAKFILLSAFKKTICDTLEEMNGKRGKLALISNEQKDIN